MNIYYKHRLNSTFHTNMQYNTTQCTNFAVVHISKRSQHKFDSGLLFFFLGKIDVWCLMDTTQEQKTKGNIKYVYTCSQFTLHHAAACTSKKKTTEFSTQPRYTKNNLCNHLNFCCSLSDIQHIHSWQNHLRRRQTCRRIDVLCEMKTIKMSLRKRKSKAHPLVVAVACNDGGSHSKNARTRWR